MPYPYQAYQPMQQMYQPVQQSYQQPVHGFVYVTGMDGAKAYQMPPNSEMPLFDSTGDILYIKTTDGAGFPTITVCDVYKRGEAKSGEYVTRDELDKTYRDLAGQLDQMRGVVNGLVPTATQPDAREADAGQADAWGRPADGGASGAHVKPAVR